jgi:ABC-type transport system involved in cytochrome bd biosynthesis fused ATPase/permease subunit
MLGQARRFGAAGYRRVLAWQLTRTVLRLGFLGSAAFLTGHVIMAGTVDAMMLGVMLGILALALMAGLAADHSQARAEAEVATTVRALAGRRFAAMPARLVQSLSHGAVIVGMQRHPGALAALVVGHRAAGTMMGLGPFLAAGALMFVSWQAALAVLLLTPAMIVFFVLLGTTIRARAEAQERAFGRLAGQFADRIRTLPTILANHALADEEAKLGERLQLHTKRTMGVLRVAFLNAGVIDFFSSLSIAILAVLLGLGHLGLATIPGFARLELWQSLFVLMLASEYFVPFRRYAEQYHAKAEGLAAAVALDAILDAPLPPEPLPELKHAVPGRLPAKGLVVLCGPSGAGKSTLLRRMAGLSEDAGDKAPSCRPALGVTWIATDSFVAAGSLGEAIAQDNALEHFPEKLIDFSIKKMRKNRELEEKCDSEKSHFALASPARILLAAGQVGLLDDDLLPGGLEARIEAGGANLSGGQRIRIGTARALAGNRPVFADEPTAKLDRATAILVRRALADMAANRLVVAATHDSELIRMASMTIELGRVGQAAGEPRP